METLQNRLNERLNENSIEYTASKYNLNGVSDNNTNDLQNFLDHVEDKRFIKSWSFDLNKDYSKSKTIDIEFRTNSLKKVTKTFNIKGLKDELVEFLSNEKAGLNIYN